MVCSITLPELIHLDCLLARGSRQEAAAEGRIDSRGCVVNMCVLGEKSCFEKI